MCNCIHHCACPPDKKPVPHKHAEVIKAWADGAKIQCKNPTFNYWRDVASPSWSTACDYRIKPEPKPDVIVEGTLGLDATRFLHLDDPEIHMKVHTYPYSSTPNIRVTFEGETGKLKSVTIV
jgi:hypothetical protein